MTDESRLPVTCKCGKKIQRRNYAQHCTSKHHLAFLIKEKEQLPSNDGIFHLTGYLREYDLHSNRSCIQSIVQRYANTDPYTKAKFDLGEDQIIPANFHVDHIHEAQILACAIRHTPGLTLPHDGNILPLRPLRKILNDTPNLAITKGCINQSKGQAVKYFLGHYETNSGIPLLAAFIQTASGKERSIAHFAENIIDLIRETSPEMSESIREIRMDNGHLTGAYRYELIAEEFDTIIDRMRLDWKEGIRLRNGKIYQAYR